MGRLRRSVWGEMPLLAQAAIVVLAGFAAIGLGAALLRMLGCAKIEGIGIRGLAGLFVAALLALTANFFIPIGSMVSLSVLAFGLALFLPFARRLNGRDWLIYVTLSLAATLLVVLRRPGYDGGLYHLPHQYWMVTERSVVGLANLHGRFGFNSLLELLLAMGWIDDGVGVAPALAGLFGLFFLAMVVEGVRRAQAEQASVIVYVLVMFWLGYLCVALPPGWVGWTSTDLPAAVMVAACVYCCLLAIIHDNRNALVLAFFFAGFAAALKLSGGFVGLLPLIVTIQLAMTKKRDIPLGRIGISALLFLPWAVSNFVVTGCLAYPMASTCTPVSWQASHNALDDMMWIKAWARAPNTGLQHLTGWDWLPIWLNHNGSSLLTLAALAAAGAAFASTLSPAGGRSPKSLAVAAAFSIYAVIATAIWFLTAPDPRFAFAHLACFAMLPGLWILALRHAARGKGWRSLAWPIAGATVILGAAHFLWFAQNDAVSLLRPVAMGIPDIATEPNGPIAKPVKGDQCFLTPPPCSPYALPVETRLGPYRVYQSP